MKQEIKQKAIAANIEALHHILIDATATVAEGFAAIQQGEQNQALGALFGLEKSLEEALALQRAAVALHVRSR